jgi:mRNA-degrading endonuclease toxin of MazEF toxin-antitoxin module
LPEQEGDMATVSAVLTDHATSLDWLVRNAKYKTTLDDVSMLSVKAG